MVAITFIKRGDGWLARTLTTLDHPTPPRAEEALIAEREEITEKTGKHPIWQGYESVDNYLKGNRFRRSGQVRTPIRFGRFYGWLVEAFDARVVVEFGTAFGVSGMYWLSGLASTGGTLFTFEPNDVWAKLARKNLAAVSSDFVLTPGTFEDNAEAVLSGRAVDICFIDAIHTSAFVFAQYDILKRFMRPGGLVLFDDINFSDDMLACWASIAASPDIVSSATLASRAGIVELPGAMPT